jgi:benzoyl-CoA reductase subunit B
MGQRDLAQVMQEKIGVPSLFVESDMADPRAYAEAPTRMKMETFLEMLEAKKH